jgi:hypothetical protein
MKFTCAVENARPVTSFLSTKSPTLVLKFSASANGVGGLANAKPASSFFTTKVPTLAHGFSSSTRGVCGLANAKPAIYSPQLKHQLWQTFFCFST